jgi:hypothetical protein
MSSKFGAALAVLLAMAILPQPAAARPVSYPEAWTLQTFNEARRSAVLAHYTTTPFASYGLRAEERRYADHRFFGLQHNRLLKRWNAPDSQANLYLKLGAGGAEGRFNTADTESRAAGFAQLATDWENRRFFVSGAAGVYAAEGMAMRELSGRLGVAPYVAEFGGLHSWLMLQADYRPDALTDQGADTFTVTPLLRVFTGSVLSEFGWSSNDELLFNFTYRF